MARYEIVGGDCVVVAETDAEAAEMEAAGWEERSEEWLEQNRGQRG
ncbi:hypothetical protein ABZ215_13445 [Amycolatopsis sp. NPDC006131]